MAKRSEHLANLDGYLKEIETCQACPKLCVQACPVGEATGRERFSSWGKMTMAALLHEGHRPFTPQEAEVFYYCLGCMLCTAVCKPQVLVDDVMAEGRIAAYKAGVYPEKIDEWIDTFRKFNNPWGENLQESQRTLVDKVFWNETPQAIYLPGSTQLAKTPQHVSRTFALFQALGIDFVGLFVGTDTCTGSTLYRMGLEDLFRKHAYRVYRQLLGFKLIISGDPEVIYALRVLYPRFGFTLHAEIKHVSQFLEPYVKNHHHGAQDNRTWTLAQSPQLVRHLGIEREPNAILSLLMKQPGKKLHWDGKTAWSTGWEAPVSVLYPEVSKAIALRRLHEIGQRKPQVVMTTAPGDYLQLRTFAPDNLVVEDVIDVIHNHFVEEAS